LFTSHFIKTHCRENTWITIALLLSLFACKKGTVDLEVPESALYQITAGSKLHATFEYADGLLAKENSFGSCETPYAITSYTYQSGRLIAMQSAARGTTSSFSGAMCDPNGSYDRYNSILEYDNKGRISKIIRGKSTTALEYNGLEVTEKVSYDGQVNARIHYLKFDSKWNLTELRTPDPVYGGVQRFEYDNKYNPLYNPHIVGGFAAIFRGPNNPVRSFDAAGNLLWERKFRYNQDGLPEICEESNGGVYTYHYK
jgi:hypothetical protein